MPKANKYNDYKLMKDLSTNSAINRLALEKLDETEDEFFEFSEGDKVFFIVPENTMIVGTIVKLKSGACLVEVEGKKWLVNCKMLSFF